MVLVWGIYGCRGEDYRKCRRGGGIATNDDVDECGRIEEARREQHSEANGSKEIKEHSLQEKLPQRNIVFADLERIVMRKRRRILEKMKLETIHDFYKLSLDSLPIFFEKQRERVRERKRINRYALSLFVNIFTHINHQENSQQNSPRICSFISRLFFPHFFLNEFFPK